MHDPTATCRPQPGSRSRTASVAGRPGGAAVVAHCRACRGRPVSDRAVGRQGSAERGPRQAGQGRCRRRVEIAQTLLPTGPREAEGPSLPGRPRIFGSAVVVEIKALACEPPEDRDGPVVEVELAPKRPPRGSSRRSRHRRYAAGCTPTRPCAVRDLRAVSVSEPRTATVVRGRAERLYVSPSPYGDARAGRR